MSEPLKLQDGRSFWSASYSNFEVFKFDIATGNVLVSFSAASYGFPGTVAAGLVVYGELTAAIRQP
jgi:hypothetical protein